MIKRKPKFETIRAWTSLTNQIRSFNSVNHHRKRWRPCKFKKNLSIDRFSDKKKKQLVHSFSAYLVENGTQCRIDKYGNFYSTKRAQNEELPNRDRKPSRTLLEDSSTKNKSFRKFHGNMCRYGHSTYFHETTGNSANILRINWDVNSTLKIKTTQRVHVPICSTPQ